MPPKKQFMASDFPQYGEVALSTTPYGFAIRYIRHCIENYVGEHKSELQNIDLDKLSISCGFSVSEQTTRFVLSYRDDVIYGELRSHGTSAAGVRGPIIHAVDFTVPQMSVDNIGWQEALNNRMPAMIHAVRVAGLRIDGAKAILRDLGEFTPNINASLALRALREIEDFELDAPVSFKETK